MHKRGVIKALKRSRAEVDGMKFLLDYEDLIWRMSPNAHSVQSLNRNAV